MKYWLPLTIPLAWSGAAFAQAAATPVDLAEAPAPPASAPPTSAAQLADAAPPTSAAPLTSPAAVAEARTLFANGAEDASRGDFAAARDKFLQAMELFPRASTAYNLALCEEALGNGPRAFALSEWAAALDHGEGSLQEEHRTRLTALRAELRAQVAVVTVPVATKLRIAALTLEPLAHPPWWVATPSRDPAAVSVSTNSQLVLPPGRWQVTRGDLDRQETSTLVVTGGETVELGAPTPQAPAPRPSTAPRAEPLPSPSLPRPSAPEENAAARWLGPSLVVTGSLAAITIGAAVVWWDSRAELQRSCLDDLCPSDDEALVTRYRAAAWTTNLGAVATLAAATVSVVLWHGSSARVETTGSSLSLSGQF